MSAQQQSASPFGLVPALLALAVGQLLNTVLGPLLLDPWPTFVLLCGVSVVFASVAVGVFRPVFGAATSWSGLTDLTRERVG